MKKLKITYFMLGISLYSAYAMNDNIHENFTPDLSFPPRKSLKRNFENEDIQAKRSRRDQFGRYNFCDQTSTPVITYPALKKRLPQRRYACTEVNSTSTATVPTSMVIITLPDSPINYIPYQQKSIPLLITDSEDGMIIE